MSSFQKFYNELIAEKVREFRQEMGFTQEQMSEILGLNLKYIGHIERCERKISNRVLIRIMDLCKKQPSEFFLSDKKYLWKK